MLRGIASSLKMAIETPKAVPIPRNGVDYRRKVVLAPMVRSGELPSRLIALKYGADLVWGPETIDRSLIGCNIRHNPRTSTVEFTRTQSNGGRSEEEQAEPKENVIYRIHPERESSRLIFQIGTANPEYAVQAATLVAPYVVGVDVNAGCPKPFSTVGGMGAALLSTPDLLCDILRSLVMEVGEKFEIGISVKIRLLPKAEDTKRLVEQLCSTGITGLTIHCRTRSMRKTEAAIREQLRMVGQTCHDAGVACLMNGDVMNREDAERLAEEYGVDGAMIATAAEKNLSIFRRARDGGAVEWSELAREYTDAALSVENKWGNTKFMLAQLMPGRVQAARNLSQAKNYEDLCQRLGLDEFCERGRILDEILGIANRENKSTLREKRRAEGVEKSILANEEMNAKRQKQLQHSLDNSMSLSSVPGALVNISSNDVVIAPTVTA